MGRHASLPAANMERRRYEMTPSSEDASNLTHFLSSCAAFCSPPTPYASTYIFIPRENRPNIMPLPLPDSLVRLAQNPYLAVGFPVVLGIGSGLVTRSSVNIVRLPL